MTALEPITPTPVVPNVVKVDRDQAGKKQREQQKPRNKQDSANQSPAQPDGNGEHIDEVV